MSKPSFCCSKIFHLPHWSSSGVVQLTGLILLSRLGQKLYPLVDLGGIVWELLLRGDYQKVGGNIGQRVLTIELMAPINVVLYRSKTLKPTFDKFTTIFSSTIATLQNRSYVWKIFISMKSFLQKKLTAQIYSRPALSTRIFWRIKVATVLDNSEPVSIILRHNGTISVVSKKLMTSFSSVLTRAPMTPNDVNRRYSKLRWELNKFFIDRAGESLVRSFSRLGFSCSRMRFSYLPASIEKWIKEKWYMSL